MSKNQENPSPFDRCRLVLIAPDIADNNALIKTIEEALDGGDVASLIVPAYERDDASYLAITKEIVNLAHARDVAVFIVDNSQVMGRSGADGMHFTGNLQELPEKLENHSDKHMFGVGGHLDRHRALVVGEMQPDYIFFGKLDGDIKLEPHPKNLALGEWWASIVEIPAIIMGGQDLNGVVDVANTRAEFVGLNRAVFEADCGAKEAVAKINALLDAHGPDLNQKV